MRKTINELRIMSVGGFSKHLKRFPLVSGCLLHPTGCFHLLSMVLGVNLAPLSLWSHNVVSQTRVQDSSIQLSNASASCVSIAIIGV